VVEVEKRGSCKVFIAVKPADLQVYSSHERYDEQYTKE
jgi:hypothetical protein